MAIPIIVTERAPDSPPQRALHLASASPRRRELLETLGLSFSATGVGIDESRHAGESARDMVLRLAIAKSQAAQTPPGTVVIGSDTAVVLGDRVLGKPADSSQGVEMLLALSATTHQVMTGVAVRCDNELATAVSVTDVRFRDIGRDEAAHYWQSGEPADKAGGYGIQGLGGIFVAELRGSYTGVVGLPVFETMQLLSGFGIDVMTSSND